MPRHLLDIENHNQKNENSCWACCTRAVNNFFKEKNKKDKRQVFAGDDLLATTVNLDVGIMQNIQKALEHKDIKCFGGQDDSANLPTFDEIVESLRDNGEPLIVCVTPAKMRYDQDIEAKDLGHYVLIVGAETDGAKKLVIMDPADSVDSTFEIDFHAEQYAAPYGTRYWACTYYTEDDL